MVVEVIHNQLAQITGCWLHIQIVEPLLEPLDLGIVSVVNYTPLDIEWNEL